MFQSPMNNRHLVNTFNRFRSFAGLPRKSYYPNKTHRPHIQITIASSNGVCLIAAENQASEESESDSDAPHE